MTSAPDTKPSLRTVPSGTSVDSPRFRTWGGEGQPGRAWTVCRRAWTVTRASVDLRRPRFETWGYRRLSLKGRLSLGQKASYLRRTTRGACAAESVGVLPGEKQGPKGLQGQQGPTALMSLQSLVSLVSLQSLLRLFSAVQAPSGSSVEHPLQPGLRGSTGRPGNGGMS